MIRVEPVPEPKDFDEKVRKSGLAAIDGLAGKKTPHKRGRKFKKLADSPDKIPAKRFPRLLAKCARRSSLEL